MPLSLCWTVMLSSFEFFFVDFGQMSVLCMKNQRLIPGIVNFLKWQHVGVSLLLHCSDLFQF